MTIKETTNKSFIKGGIVEPINKPKPTISGLEKLLKASNETAGILKKDLAKEKANAIKTATELKSAQAELQSLNQITSAIIEYAVKFAVERCNKGGGISLTEVDGFKGNILNPINAHNQKFPPKPKDTHPPEPLK